MNKFINKNDCPDKNLSEVTFTCLVNEIVLHQNNDKLKSQGTRNSALLDCGTSSTVCGMEWFKQYRGSIAEIDKNQIFLSDSKRPYKFGDRKKLQTIKSAKISVLTGNQSLHILADIVNPYIPILLSKASVKKCNMKIDFVVTITICNERISGNLIAT